jgi:hypothetical protein
MIYTDHELAIVREQLGRAEKALKAIRDEVRPVNESRFLLMAESYVQMILELRGQIDTYLGLEAVCQAQTELELGLEGNGIRLGHSPASLVTRVLDAFRRGLQSVVEAVESTERTVVRTAGRRKRWIEQLCDLPLVGVASGSVRVQLGEPTSLSGALLESEDREFYQHIMGLLRDGLACATGEINAEQIPEPLRQSVLNAVRKLVPAPRGALDVITFSGRAIGGGKIYRVTRNARERLEQEVRRVAVLKEITSVEGVIREVDLDRNTFLLRERPEEAAELPCEYAENDEEDVKSFLDKRVLVSGTLRTSPKAGRQTMDVEVIEAVGVDEDQGGADIEPGDFHKAETSQLHEWRQED